MNNNFKKGLVLGLASVALLSGCGNKTIPTLQDGSQAIVTFKDDEKISINDLYSKMKSSFGLETVLAMIDKMVLEHEYPNDLEAATDSAKTSIEQLKEAYKDQLLSAIQYYTNYNTVEEYQDSLYLSYLQNKATEDYAKTQVKESEIKKYYKNEIKSDIKVSHILFSVNYDENASDDEKTAAKDEAKAKAQEILSKLDGLKGDELLETFKTLASENSSDESTKNDGGNLGFINVGTLGDSYKELVDEAYKLKDGNYSTSVIETALGYHIVLRTETKEKAALDDVRDSIIDSLVQTYLNDNADSYIKAMQNIRKKYDMNFVDDDLKNNYATYIQNALLQIQTSKEEK